MPQGAESELSMGLRLGRVIYFISDDVDLRLAIARNSEVNLLSHRVSKNSLSTNGKYPDDVKSIEISETLTMLLCGEKIEHYSMENPYRTGNDSKAIYLARIKSESQEILLQYLPPNSRTSHHSHQDAYEIYNPISGNLYIWCNQSEVVDIKSRTIFNPGESHIGFTFDKPAITLIAQKGKISHTHRKIPQLELLQEQARLQGIYPPKSFSFASSNI